MTSTELNAVVANIRLGSFHYPVRVDVIECGSTGRAQLQVRLVVAMRPERDRLPGSQADPGDDIEVSLSSEVFSFSHVTTEEVQVRIFSVLGRLLLHELQEQFRDRGGRLLFDPHEPAIPGGREFRVDLRRDANGEAERLGSPGGGGGERAQAAAARLRAGAMHSAGRLREGSRLPGEPGRPRVSSPGRRD